MLRSLDKIVSQMSSDITRSYQNGKGKTITGNAASNHNTAEIGGIEALISLAAMQGYRQGQYDLRMRQPQQLYRLIGESGQNKERCCVQLVSQA